MLFQQTENWNVCFAIRRQLPVLKFNKRNERHFPAICATDAIPEVNQISLGYGFANLK